MEAAIGEYVANHHVVFCKSIGLVTISETHNDIDRLKVLVSDYKAWCYKIETI